MCGNKMRKCSTSTQPVQCTAKVTQEIKSAAMGKDWVQQFIEFFIANACTAKSTPVLL